MSGGTRRPFRVHVHDIGPNFSYSTPERAFERIEKLLDLGCHATITLLIAEHEREVEGDPRVLLRRIRYTYVDGAQEYRVVEEVFARGSSGWRSIEKGLPR